MQGLGAIGIVRGFRDCSGYSKASGAIEVRLQGLLKASAI